MKQVKHKEMIFRDKMIRYPKHEQESDRKLLKELDEILNRIKQLCDDKENDGKKQDANS